MASLEIITGPCRGLQCSLTEPSIMVGRAPVCSISIPDDMVSRRHLQILFEQETGLHFAVDVGSANGVHVNGVRLERGNREQLADGDEILIGASRLIYVQSADDRAHMDSG